MWEDDEQNEAEASILLQIRESIKALFPNRTCFPLVRPMSDESQLQRLEAVPPSQLRPEFKQVGPSASSLCENENSSLVQLCYVQSCCIATVPCSPPRSCRSWVECTSEHERSNI